MMHSNDSLIKVAENAYQPAEKSAGCLGGPKNLQLPKSARRFGRCSDRTVRIEQFRLNRDTYPSNRRPNRESNREPNEIALVNINKLIGPQCGLHARLYRETVDSAETRNRRCFSASPSLSACFRNLHCQICDSSVDAAATLSAAVGSHGEQR